MKSAKKLLAFLLTAILLLGLLPATALAIPAIPFTATAGETALTVVQSDTDYEYTETIYDSGWNPIGTQTHTVPLFTVTVPDGATGVTLDFGTAERIAYAYTAAGDYVAACGDYGGGTTGQTTATVTGFENFVRVQTPYDAYWNSDFLYAVGFEAEEPAIPFTATAGETALTVVQSDTDYEYTETIYDSGWNPIGTQTHTVPLFTVTVPDGATGVTLDFGTAERIAYAYTAAGDYVAACGDYGDGTQGKTTATATDYSDFIRVQTPYDAYWNSDFLYAVAFEMEEVALPFTASAGETALAVVRSDTDYEYTEVVYDASWSPIGTETRSVPLYVVTVPADAAAVTLDFGTAERIAYAYTADGDYIAACGDYGDGTQGKTTATATDFDNLVRVQTPYDAYWNSDFLYAVAFDAAGSGTPDPSTTVDLDLLIAMLGADWGEKTGDWEIISAGMYETLYGVTPDVAAAQARLDAVAGRISGAMTDADAAKAILALRSCGFDPAHVTTSVGLNYDLTSILTATTTNNIYNAPYVLLAYQQGNYDADKEAALCEFILDNQGTDGSWATSPDTTGIVLTALAAYAGDATVDAAMAKGRDYLLGCISPAGTCSSVWSSDNADTTAMAAMGLAAAGIDPSDARNGTDGTSIAEGLLSFAVSDYSGFGYTDASVRNDIATRDGFWGALCVEFGAGTRLFDFTGNAAAPARATQTGGSSSSGAGQSSTPTTDPDLPEETVSVTFSITGNSGAWLAARKVKTAAGATAIDVLRQVLDASANFTYVESSGYLRSITRGGETLGEFTEGPNSGWKYKVNGEAPTVGMGSYVLADGDKLVVYYVKDYTTDPTPDQGNPTAPSDGQSGAQDVTPAPVEPAAPFTDTVGHPASAAIDFCREKGFMSGTGAGTFAPEAPLTRAMLVTILYNLEGKPAAAGAAFPDVSDGAWYDAPVAWAVQLGLCSGYGSGLFGPDNDVSREQLAIILERYAQYKRAGAFTIPESSFDGITRGETAVLIMDYLQSAQ